MKYIIKLTTEFVLIFFVQQELDQNWVDMIFNLAQILGSNFEIIGWFE